MRSRVKYVGVRDYNKVHIIKNNIYFTVALDKHTHSSFPSHIFFYILLCSVCSHLSLVVIKSILCLVHY